MAHGVRFAGIYEPSELCEPEDKKDPERMLQNCVVNVCQPGSGLLAAGYCLYSSSVILVLSIGTGVYGFTYDSLVGEFILTHPEITVRVMCPEHSSDANGTADDDLPWIA